MNYKIGIFFCAVFVLTAITSIQAVPQFSYENDVTKHMDDWITKVLKINSDAFKKLFGKIMQKDVPTFAHEMKGKVDTLGSTLNLRDIYMNISEFKSPQLNWKFSANKMSFFLKEFAIRCLGYVNGPSEATEDYAHFDTILSMENVTFTFTSNGDKATTEFTHDEARLQLPKGKQGNFKFIEGTPSDTEKNKLDKELQTGLVALVRHTILSSKPFATALLAIFDVYLAPKSVLKEKYSDFFTNKDDKYYYLIPKIPYFSFNLKNVFIKGIWNLEWMKINTGVSIFTHTLMVRDVQGNFLLDFGEKPETPVELSFKIDYLSLSADRKTINVDARCYSVNKTNTPLSYRQSSLIMQRIESTIASSIFPTLTYRQTYDIDSPLDTFKTENVDWNEVKKQFHEWIPFS